MTPRIALSIVLIGVAFGQCTDLGRSKRAVIYQRGATTTILAALAIPVDIEMPNAYVAINYAANYMNPQNASYFTQPFNRFHEKNKRAANPAGLISRSSFYKTVISELDKYGFNGRLCLLSTICEVNSEKTVARHNGVIGSIITFLFSPSLSGTEKGLPEIFYKAERMGKAQDCRNYKDKCPRNVLDLISQFQ